MPNILEANAVYVITGVSLSRMSVSIASSDNTKGLWPRFFNNGHMLSS